ncbi:MAG: hypothetical protein AT711_04120 [Thermoproteus sp. CIS_19]|jgi:Uncharacterized protein conserved in archaea|nr:MAG: hypothetical protein AT711_04120 [Thermoproteus sp. CIS_19]
MNVLRKKLHVDILLHLKRAGVDYGKSISRALDAPLASVLAAPEELEAAGLVERVGGRVLKRDKARMKTAHEVRKHHVYYRLSRTGELLLRCLRARGPAAYLEAMTGEEKKAWLMRVGGPDRRIGLWSTWRLVDGDGTPTELGRVVASLLDPSCAGRL